MELVGQRPDRNLEFQALHREFLEGKPEPQECSLDNHDGTQAYVLFYEGQR